MKAPTVCACHRLLLAVIALAPCSASCHVCDTALGKTHFIIDSDGQDVPSPCISTTAVPQAAPIPSRELTVLFAPSDNVRATLLELIKNEQQKITLAAYIISDRHVAEALIDARERGVQIEVITDPACLQARSSKIELLRSRNVPIFVYKGGGTHDGSKGCMHHKFIVFGKNRNGRPLVWTGSCNFTHAAPEHNHENVVLIDDDAVAKKFGDQFEHIKKSAYALQPINQKIARGKRSIKTRRST